MNRLSNEKSLYLRQHSDNPVDWYPWSDEAFEQAKIKTLPIFLSIGYTTCHWCHVMERESFQSDEIAEIMNKNFINIKVDREEFPDVDSIYMKAVQSISGTGGWPLSVFLTPDLNPFYGGTYFPPTDRHGMPSFSKVLLSISDHWYKQPNLVTDNAEQLKKLLANQNNEDKELSNVLSEEKIFELSEGIISMLDFINGGTRGFPKFPQVPLFDFLSICYRYKKDERVLRGIKITLDNINKGGIHDHLFGGFHRYSTDEQWSVPHFEKMLYDNALIARLFIYGYRVSNNNTYLDIAEKTLKFISTEMWSSDNGFISSIDADTNGVEGYSYTWDYRNLITILNEDQLKLANEHWILSETGNYEGRNVLNIMNTLDSFKSNSNDVSDYKELLIIYEKLKKNRSERLQPKKDTKMIVSWMSLVIQAIGEFLIEKENNEWLYKSNLVMDTIFSSANGEKIFHIIEEENGSLKGRIPGYLSDFSELALACLALYKCTYNEKWMKKFIILGELISKNFWDVSHESFIDSSNNKNLYITPRDTFDSPTYSGISSANLVMLYSYSVTGEEKFINIFEKSVHKESENIIKYPNAYSGWISGILISNNLEQVVIVGDINHPNTKEMLKIASSGHNPSRIVIHVEESNISNLSITKDKKMINGYPTGYYCKDFVCKNPTNSIKEFTRNFI